jgi:hypothetical protein
MVSGSLWGILVRQDEAVLPNLDRISGQADDLARNILTGLPQQVDELAVAGLQETALLALGRYGVRAVTLALREHSLDRLRDALTASALAALGRNEDARDLMVGLALHHVAAQRLDHDSTMLFDEVAYRLPDGDMSRLLMTFGSRRDVTLDAFGWTEVLTPYGPDFLPV